MKKNNPIIQWWMTPKFPLIHLYDKTAFIKRWIFHPVKRRIARWYLMFLQKFSDIKVIGITGSAGKTTTKEILAAILKLDGKTVYSKANIDPIYNIPTTILKTPFGTKYLIIEMGVEYPDEMDFYLWLAKPDIGVITNIFPTHLEFLKNINGVLAEKIKLVLSLDKEKTAVLNSNDADIKKLASRIKAKIIWFDSDCDQLGANCAAATAVANSLKIPKEIILKGIESYQKPNHRLDLITLKSGAVILDDSYNSNPHALAKTLEHFIKIAGKGDKIAVLGDMKELGEFEEKYHRDLGRIISGLNFEAVIGVGSAIADLTDEVKGNTKTYIVENQAEVLPLLRPYLQKGNYILIKGSRSIALDKLVDTLV